MSVKLEVTMGGEVDAPVVDYTDAVTFLGDADNQLGMQFDNGGASQGTFVLDDDDGVIPKSDDTRNLAAHNLVTLSEDASGTKLWLAVGIVAPKDSHRNENLVAGDARQYDVTVEDANALLRLLKLTEDWERPAETGYARLVALQAYTLAGASSTATWHSVVTDITVDSDHKAPNTNTVTMPAKTYDAGTGIVEIIQDCADTEGKVWGVTIHHEGGSHLCLQYILENDNTTALSPVKISDVPADHDFTSLTAPCVPPSADATSHEDGQELPAVLIVRYGSGDKFVLVTDGATSRIASYGYAADVYFDEESVTEAQATAKGQAILAYRGTEHVTHELSIRLKDTQVGLIEVGQSIVIRSTALIGGQYLNTEQTRRIALLKWELESPRVDDVEAIWVAHLQLDRALRRSPYRKGNKATTTAPKPPDQGTPGTPATSPTPVYQWHFATDLTDDDTSTIGWGLKANRIASGAYDGGPYASVGFAGASTNPRMTVTAGTLYSFSLHAKRNDQPGSSISVKWYDTSGSLISTDVLAAAGSLTESWAEFSGAFTAPTGATNAAIAINTGYPRAVNWTDVVVSTGGSDAVPGLPGDTDQLHAPSGSGTLGTSNKYMPIDTILPAQTASDTSIVDSDGNFIAENVEDALAELQDNIDAVIAGDTLGWFDVTAAAYGAVGDGTTDDTSAINLAIAALNTATRGVLYFPAGTYKTTAGLTAITVPCLIRGDGHTGVDGSSAYVSKVFCSSSTATLFTIQTHAYAFEGLALVNTAASTPTAGAGIAVTANGDHGAFRDISVKGFYIDIDVQEGAEWRMEGCYLHAPVLYGLKVRHVDLPDGGDWSISDTWITADVRDATSALRIESSGGGKITNLKINGRSGTYQFTHGIDLAVGASTSVLHLANCSIENVSGDGVHCTNTASKLYSLISVSDCEFGLYSNATGHAISITGTAAGDFADILIGPNLYKATGGNSGAAVALTNVDNATILPGEVNGFGSLLSTTSCTNVSNYSAPLSAGSTAGGDLSGTYPNPTVATVGGVSAAAIAAAVSSPPTVNFHFEAIMTGSGASLEPLQTNDGTDWVYGKVYD